MRAVCRAVTLCWVLGLSLPAAGAAGGPLLSVPTPSLREFELALDELELDWSRMPGAKQQAPGRQAVAAAGAAFTVQEELRALALFPAAADAAALRAVAETLHAANPAAEIHLVLYEPGRPRSERTRRLLSREVGLLLEAGADPQAVVAGLSVLALRPVAGLATGYVADAADPLAALELAAALQGRPGVKRAYPLLKRQFVRK